MSPNNEGQRESDVHCRRARVSRHSHRWGIRAILKGPNVFVDACECLPVGRHDGCFSLSSLQLLFVSIACLLLRHARRFGTDAAKIYHGGDIGISPGPSGPSPYRDRAGRDDAAVLRRTDYYELTEYTIRTSSARSHCKGTPAILLEGQSTQYILSAPYY